MKTEIECNEKHGFGGLRKTESEKLRHQVSGVVVTRFKKCTAKAPVKCTVKEPIEIKAAYEGVEGLGAGKMLLTYEEPLWAPHLIDAEVGHALRQGVRRGTLDEDVASQALWMFDDLLLRRVPHEHLFRYAWTLRDNCSFYDALYVALAEMMDEPLITFDARLARSAVRAEIEVLA